MKNVAMLFLMALAAGCATPPAEFNPVARAVLPKSEEPVTLGPGVYRIQLPRDQTALLRVEGCGAMWVNTVSEDHDTHVNTLIYGPEPRIAINTTTSNGMSLANCVMVSDGSNTHFYFRSCTNSSIVLDESTVRREYTLEHDPEGHLWLKGLPNQGMQPTK
jgi:hypothetical protein